MRGQCFAPELHPACVLSFPLTLSFHISKPFTFPSRLLHLGGCHFLLGQKAWPYFLVVISFAFCI